MGLKTVGWIAREHEVHPVKMTQWKGVIRDHLPEFFDSPQPASEDHERTIAQLQEQIGRLSVEDPSVNSLTFHKHENQILRAHH
jgi:transposase